MTANQPSVHQLYKRLQAVGKGSYGSVHKGIEIATGNVVALKIINLEDDEVEGIQHEVALLSQLRDAPNVTKYFGSFLDGPRLWIVMELAQGGSVYQLMKASPGNTLDERHVVVLVREVLIGLAYLHKSGVIHRDIKSANVLVTAQGKVMICDFGVSALLATTASKRNTFIGTLNWMAPEVVQAVPNYDTKADIWSLGIMIYEMIKGSPPHSNVSQERVIQLIPRAKPPRLVPGEGSKDLLDFIPLCLSEKPGDRLPAEELLKSKWIKAAARVPVTTLKELLLQYETWQKTSKEARDLAEPLPWEKDEADELGFVNVPQENDWEFNTVRGSRALNPTAVSSLLAPATSANTDTGDGESNSTVRPPQSKLPSSLRLLFDDGADAPPDPFRIPGFPGGPAKPFDGPAKVLDAPAPSPPLESQAPRVRPRRAQTTPLQQPDGLDLSKAAFAFPPPRTTRPRDDDEQPTSSRGPSPAESMLASGGGADKTAPFYRAVRSARNVPDLAIPPPPAPLASLTGTGADDDAVGAGAGISLDGALISSTTGRRSRARTYASPPGFQFPPAPVPGPASASPLTSSSSASTSTSASSPASASSGQSSSRTVVARDRSRGSQSHAHTSTSSVSPGAFGHSATHSLEAAPARRAPALLAPASAGIALTRSHSAMAEPAAPLMAAARRPSLTRQASVAVMETPRRGARQQRSGSSLAELSGIAGPPGARERDGSTLRDVLKVPALSSEHQYGMADLGLLPPSPSAATAPALAKAWAPSPSGLHAAFSAGAETARTASPLPMFERTPGSVFASTPALGGERTPALAGGERGGGSSGGGNGLHARGASGGPAVRALDFGAVVRSHDATHSELARIVEDLGQWLAVAEVGLTRMLESAGEDRIEEEDGEDPNGGGAGPLIVGA